MKGTVLLLAILVCAMHVQAAEFPEPLPGESTGQNTKLPEKFPKHWMFLLDLNFPSLIDGKVVLVDLGDTTEPYKGLVGAGQFANFLLGAEESELYVAETFYSRRIRGERTDTITIYDAATLKFKDEIILPAKRGLFVTHKNAFRFTAGERLGLVYNFTPAASVTVVDLQGRKVLNEIPIPGCSLIYPTGKRGFSTLCGNGKMMTINLDADGKVTGSNTTKEFDDIDNDALFMTPARIDDQVYFVSFKGHVQPIDVRGESIKVGVTWSLVPKAEAKDNWRPAGWQVVSGSPEHRLYVLMQKNGHEGSHKDGGGEVWVFDVKKKKRVQRIKLKTHGISIEVTQDKKPLLAVTNENMKIDVYSAADGKYLRTLGGGMAESPFTLYAVH